MAVCTQRDAIKHFIYCYTEGCGVLSYIRLVIECQYLIKSIGKDVWWFVSRQIPISIELATFEFHIQCFTH